MSDMETNIKQFLKTFYFYNVNMISHCILKEFIPSASSILGMSRYFSATSKAVLRLPIGSSCKGRHSQQELNEKR